MGNLTPHAARRLKTIDQYLAFTGRVQRSDLISHFDIGIATASRSFKEYRSLHPDNMDYSVSDRCYVASSKFVPAYEHETDAALRLIAYGQETLQVGVARDGIDPPLTLTASIKPDCARTITSAMISGGAVNMVYSSGSSGSRGRVVEPHAIFHAGGTWYFRCLNREKDDYRTFRFSRIKSAELIPGLDSRQPRATQIDAEWHSKIMLTLAPHPKRDNQEALREDLGLTDKPVMNIEVNEVMAGFVLVDLRVDCSESADLNPYEYHLRLLNRHDLLSVGSLKIAPGFNK